MQDGGSRKAVWILAATICILLVAIVTKHAGTIDGRRRKLYKSLVLFGISPDNVGPSTAPVTTSEPSTTYRVFVPPTKQLSAPSTDSPSFHPSPLPSRQPSASPTAQPSASPSHSPTTKPSASPSSSPTSLPSRPPTSVPSQSPTDFFAETVFYAVADLPYNLLQKQKMPGLIASIPEDASFVIHLGDIKSSATPCNNATFQVAERILARRSKVPAFFVVGDNEWNDCDDPHQALKLWRSMFVRFDRKYWTHDLSVTTMPGRPESFSFINRGTLFIGLNLVGAPVKDWTEWNNRTTTQLEWTLSLIERHRSGENAIGAIVIFGHANLDGKHRLFTDPLVNYVQTVLQNTIPIMYIGGDNHDWLFEPSYRDQPSFLRVRKTGGTTEPPLRIVVNPSASRMVDDYGTKATETSAFHLTRFPSQVLNFNRAESKGGDGIASEDLDDDYF